jgi:hypothetical protein
MDRYLQFSVKLWQRVEGNLFEWIGTGPISQVRAVLKFSVEAEVSSSWSGGVRVVPHRGRTKVVPCYRLSSLEEPLSWMVWFDEWNASPPALPVARSSVRRASTRGNTAPTTALSGSPCRGTGTGSRNQTGQPPPSERNDPNRRVFHKVRFLDLVQIGIRFIALSGDPSHIG